MTLWLYDCIRGIGSARELARRCLERAAFRWLCGGVSVNYRLLADFRTEHGTSLDDLFTQGIASVVDKDVVPVSRVSQDGVRIRVSADGGRDLPQTSSGQRNRQRRPQRLSGTHPDHNARPEKNNVALPCSARWPTTCCTSAISCWPESAKQAKTTAQTPDQQE